MTVYQDIHADASNAVTDSKPSMMKVFGFLSVVSLMGFAVGLNHSNKNNDMSIDFPKLDQRLTIEELGEIPHDAIRPTIDEPTYTPVAYTIMDHHGRCLTVRDTIYTQESLFGMRVSHYQVLLFETCSPKNSKQSFFSTMNGGIFQSTNYKALGNPGCIYPSTRAGDNKINLVFSLDEKLCKSQEKNWYFLIETKNGIAWTEHHPPVKHCAKEYEIRYSKKNPDERDKSKVAKCMVSTPSGFPRLAPCTSTNFPITIGCNVV